MYHENPAAKDDQLGGMTLPLTDVLADPKKRIYGWFDILEPDAMGGYTFRADLPADDDSTVKSDEMLKMNTIMRLGLGPS